MNAATLLLLSLMLPIPSVSLIQLVSHSCDQTWLGGVPSAPIDASFELSSDGAHMAIGELEYPASVPGYPNATDSLIYITPQPIPTVTFAPLGPTLGPWRIWMSADGYIIAAPLKDYGVQLFNGAYPVFDWKLPGTPYNSLGVSGDGKYVVALIENTTSNTLSLLSTLNYSTAWTYHFDPSVGNTTSFQSVGVSYDAGRIAVLQGRTIFVFSKSSNQALWSKVVESSQTDSSDIIGSSETQVFMSQDGNFLTTIEDATITIYSASTGAIEGTLTLDRDWIPPLSTPDETFALSNDSSTLAVIDGSKVRAWDRATGTQLFSKDALDRIQVGSSTVDEHATSVSLSQDGTVIAVGSGQRGIFVYDKSGNELCKVYDGSSNLGVLSNLVKVSDDGKHVAAFAQDTAALYTITPQYVLLILTDSAIAAATIILGYLGLKRLRKIMSRRKRRKWHEDHPGLFGSPENAPGPFGPPPSTDPH